MKPWDSWIDEETQKKGNSSINDFGLLNADPYGINAVKRGDSQLARDVSYKMRQYGSVVPMYPKISSSGGFII